MSNLHVKTLVAAVTASLLVAAGAASAQIVGGGATLPENLYNGPGTAFNTGIITSIAGFNKYIGVGSGNGKKAFFENQRSHLGLPAGPTVHYAGSDSLVTKAELDFYNLHTDAANNKPTTDLSKFGPLVQIPVALTSVTVPYNVPGLTKLNLTSAELVKIFSGQVDNWKDVVVDIVNGVEVKGPTAPITIVYRSGGSGTTEIFVRHLNAITEVGAPTTISSNFATAFPQALTDAKYVAASGTSGVISAVRNTPYSISYVSPEVVDINSATEVASIWNKDLAGTDAYVLPTVNNVRAAVSLIPTPVAAGTQDKPLTWGIGHGDTKDQLAKPALGYPITGVTNLILSQCYSDIDVEDGIKSFLNNNYSSASTASSNDAKIIANNLVPLPINWQNAVHATFAASNSTLAIGNTSACAGYAGR